MNSSSLVLQLCSTNGRNVDQWLMLSFDFSHDSHPCTYIRSVSLVLVIPRASISFSCFSALCFLFSQNSRSKLVLLVISFVLLATVVLHWSGR